MIPPAARNGTRPNHNSRPLRTESDKPTVRLRVRVDAVDGSSIRQQTSVINVIRAHLAEFGIVAPVGRKGLEQLLSVVADAGDSCRASQGSARQRLTQKRLSGASIVASPEQSHRC
jgi:hypothetical protein